jgi:hypothetical protein
MKSKIYFLTYLPLLFVLVILINSCTNEYYLKRIIPGEHIAPRELLLNTSVIIETKTNGKIDSKPKKERTPDDYSDAHFRKVILNTIKFSFALATKEQYESFDKDKYRFVLMNSSRGYVGGTYFDHSTGKTRTDSGLLTQYAMLDRKTGKIYKDYEVYETDQLKGLKIYIEKLNQIYAGTNKEKLKK